MGHEVLYRHVAGAGAEGESRSARKAFRRGKDGVLSIGSVRMEG